MHQPKLRIVLLFGGRSSEHSISCATAAGVLGAIDRGRYEVIPVGITRQGAFVLESDDPTRLALDPAQLPEVVDNGTRISWPTSAASRQLTVTAADGMASSLGLIDLVFPILHGPFGEDGTVQGMLQLLGIPYVGAGVLASAVGMDKHFTKSVLLQAGLPVVPWQLVTERQWLDEPDHAVARITPLGLPLFVKPARAGSSVGVSRVTDLTQLPAAMALALREDDKVLVEIGILGREIEIGVLGARPGEPVRASTAGEIVVGERDFYDFDAKYLDASGVELLCPAKLSAAELAEARALAIRAFEAIDCAGLARVDFFLTPGGFVINEINTMPGFTPISMFPKCWLASGLSYPELIHELIAVGLATSR